MTAMKESVENCLALLRTGYCVPYHEGYPLYDPRIMAVCETMEECRLENMHYLELIEKVRKKRIERLTLSEVYIYLTYIFRQERFCDGNINIFIENGILLRVLTQYVLLTQSPACTERAQ